MQKRGLEIGSQAPDFSLKDQNGDEFKLSNYKGKKILLSFHPLAWTSICSKQMLSLEENYNKFLELNTIPVGVSVDPVPSKKAWAENLQLKNLKILSDFWPHGKVAKLFNIFREEDGFSERANIIIDEEGKIVFFKIYPIRELPDINEIIEFLSNK
ncbi:peroxiredoxin [Dictyoglomus thermophilum]|uniref:Thioredoxin peroxidase n=2 Tax=Dictyoglomus thermophilum TaxID=14 RepID=B5YCM6_DICT6|nr:peroxiredoxin [Dictyoglomus thermophilum]ACI18345.1 thioredoxin peroxidase [Dictyoglomus thermophilum H-6-12]MCX7720144.1 peroxiredoxin [Dictyoglomus thermophilum]TYT23387.1 peroxiredoxin [Dictyoglomus thermophilum]